MRKYVTAAATALTLGVFGIATPAFADHNDYNNGGNYSQNNQYQNNQYPTGRYDDDQPYQGQWNNGGRKFDFNRQEGNFDRWERGWGNQGFNEFRNHRPLTYWRLVRRLETQGYHGVRGLRQSRFGWGWRAFAFTGRGRPVMLQINPYSGRVISARYI